MEIRRTSYIGMRTTIYETHILVYIDARNIGD